MTESSPSEATPTESVQDDRPSTLVATLDRTAASNLRVLGIQVALAVLAYAVMLGGPLFFDDNQFIVWNEHVKNFDLGEIYTSSVTEGAGFQSNTYRPNQQFVFALFYKIFGTSPYPYHAFSLSVHIANAFLVFLLLCRLEFVRTASFLASLVFLVHPVQTQAVSYASGLAGPFGLLFVLGALHTWLASLQATTPAKRWALLAGSLLLAVEALFTKSNMVIVLPLLVVLASYLVLTGREKVGGYFVGSVAAFGLLAFGYLGVKLTLLDFAGGLGMVEGYNIYTENLHVRLFTFVSVLDRYLELIVWPAVLSYTKPRLIYSSLLTIHGALGVAILGVGLLALVRAPRWPGFFLAVGWFFAALAPFSGVIPLASMYLEHWLYAPLIGVVIGLAALYQRARKEVRNNIATLAVGVLLIMTVRTAARNHEWSDPERFYRADMRAAGYTVQMLNNLATHQMSIGEDDRAIETLDFLIQGNDSSPEPHDNLAQIHARRGDYMKARAEFERALEIDPENRNALMGLRKLYDDHRKTAEAMKLEQRIRAIERDERL